MSFRALPLLFCLLLLSFSTTVNAFAVALRCRCHRSAPRPLLATTDDDQEQAYEYPTGSAWTRRDLLTSLTVPTVGTLLPISPAFAKSSKSVAAWGTTPEHPVVVVGAGGRTGMEVVQALAKQGLYVVSLTRTGTDPFRIIKIPESVKNYIQHYPEPVSVTSEAALRQALKSTGASAIIYCASASKKGGTASEVDDLGVGTTAQLAKEFQARLVVISALAVDRPDSKSFQITNTIGGNFNGIMDAKRQGEQKVRSTMNDYVILRPGVLVNGKGAKGVMDIELNQGDLIGGGLSREELAGVAVGALQSGQQDLTVEVYRKSTATKLQPEFPSTSGKEVSGATTYTELFAKLPTN